jgi:hypothetical protein
MPRISCRPKLSFTQEELDYLTKLQTQYHNPVMNVNVKITRFCNWLQSM